MLRARMPQPAQTSLRMTGVCDRLVDAAVRQPVISCLCGRPPLAVPSDSIAMAITSYTDNVGLRPGAGVVPSSLRTSTLKLYLRKDRQ